MSDNESINLTSVSPWAMTDYVALTRGNRKKKHEHKSTVPTISVKTERKVKAEVLAMDDPKGSQKKKLESIDMTLEEFCLAFITETNHRRVKNS